MAQDTSIQPEGRTVESESATTDHAANHAGALPVVLSLAILAILALLTFATTSCVASVIEVPLYNELTRSYSGGVGYDDLDTYDLLEQLYGNGYDFEVDPYGDSFYPWI